MKDFTINLKQWLYWDLSVLVLQFLLSLYLLQKKKKNTLRNNVATSFAWAVVFDRGGPRVGKRIIIVDYSIILKFLTIMIMYLFKN